MINKVSLSLITFIVICCSYIVSAQETYLDNFNVVSYSNNNGTRNFSSSWVETGDLVLGPILGNILIASNQLRFTGILLDNNIRRSLNLEDVDVAILTLDYDATSRGGETMDVELWNKTTGLWDVVYTIDTDIVGSMSYLLNENQISDESAIRFISRSGAWGIFDRMYIDNVQFETFTDTDGDGIAENIDIDDDNDGILDVVENTNCSSLSQTFNYSSHYTDGEDPTLASSSENGVIFNFNRKTTAGVTLFDGNIESSSPFSGFNNYWIFNQTNNSSIDKTTATISFSIPIMVSFTLLDVDADASSWIDKVIVNGYVNGSLVTLTASDFILNATYTKYNGLNEFEGIADTDSNGNVSITFPTLVDKIEIIYSDGESPFGSQVLGISPITYCPPIDTDGDGRPDSVDLDSDNDGIPDNIESQTTLGYIEPSGFDIDKNGLDDAYEVISGSGEGLTPINAESADSPDYIDLDSDNDLLLDSDESGIVLTNSDSDGDGLDDSMDETTDYSDPGGIIDNPISGSYIMWDSDGDVASGGDVNYRDANDDGSDTDGDGISDGIDIDDDNDGILDTDECPPVTGSVDSGNNTTNITGFYASNGNSVLGFTINPEYASGVLSSTSGVQIRWDQGTTDAITTVDLILDTPSTGTLKSVILGNGAEGVTAGTQNAYKEITLTWSGGGSAVLNDPLDEVTGRVTGDVLNSGDIIEINNGVRYSLQDTEWSVEVDMSSVSTFPTTVSFYADSSINGSTNYNREGFAFTPVISCPDADGDGLSNNLDLDSDGDGIPDHVEAQTTLGYALPSGNDIDGNGLDDAYETTPGSGEGLTPVDTDALLSSPDAIPDYLDLNSDNEGANDTEEARITLSGNDADTDGLDDATDATADYSDPGGTIDNPLSGPVIIIDLDNDASTGGDVDFRDDDTSCTITSGIIINEKSNGNGGSQDWVELLVVGDAADPTAPVDLTGWFVDDNNGDFEGAVSTGVAQGSLVLGSAFNAVTPGSIIVIYNQSDKDAAIPVDDPTDSDGDGVYILPGNHASLSGCSNSPSTSNSSYLPCTPVAASWSRIAFRNSGDAVQTRRPDGTFYHGYSTGNVGAPFPNFPCGGQSFNLGSGGVGSTFSFQCGDWEDSTNFIRTDQTGRTPGEVNSVENQYFVSKVINGTLDYSNLNNINNCAGADLSLKKSVNNSTPNVGDAISFRIIITNNGSLDASLIEVQDVLPSDFTYNHIPANYSASEGVVTFDASSRTMTWNAGSYVLTTGSSMTLIYTVTVDVCGEFKNRAEITNSSQLDVDSTPGNGN